MNWWRRFQKWLRAKRLRGLERLLMPGCHGLVLLGIDELHMRNPGALERYLVRNNLSREHFIEQLTNIALSVAIRDWLKNGERDFDTTNTKRQISAELLYVSSQPLRA